MLARWGYRRPDAWDELLRLSRELDRRGGRRATTARTGVFPPFNMYDDGESLVVRAEIPGADPADLEIRATNNALTIKGERKVPPRNEKESSHRRERGFGTFNRTFTLPYEIDSNKVMASYKLGVLEVILPKAEALKPRKVEVKG